ncbi:MAG: shikimate dehydrogenase [Dehalococcoidia bacterium]
MSDETPQRGRRRAGVIGKPIGHSLSPAMQNAAFKAVGLAAWYEAIELEPEEAPAFFQILRQPGWLGVNVTVPHKETAARLVDRQSAEAARAGAVNTVVCVDGELIGHNTDIAGFLRALLEDAKFNPDGRRAVVVGAGGAARACVVALAASVVSVTVVNRDVERAARLVATLGEPTVNHATGLAALTAIRDADLLVNATSVGMQGGPAPDGLPIPDGWLPDHGLVYDLVYRPMETPLLRAARSAGLQTLDGLAMLVYQGAAAFELWTGRAAPIERMRAAALARVEEASACSDS